MTDSEGSQEEIEAFLEENGYTYPVLMDTTGEIFMEYGNTTRWTKGNVEVTIDIPNYHDEENEVAKRFITMGLREELFQKIMKEDYIGILQLKNMDSEKIPDGRYLGGDMIYIK